MLSFSSTYLYKRRINHAQSLHRRDVLYCHTTFNTANRKATIRGVGEAGHYTRLPFQGRSYGLDTVTLTGTVGRVTSWTDLVRRGWIRQIEYLNMTLGSANDQEGILHIHGIATFR